jgi:hypothetical protein
MTGLSKKAQAAQDAARKQDGEFGVQPHAESGVVPTPGVDPRIGREVVLNLKRGDREYTQAGTVVDTEGVYSNWGTVQVGDIEVQARIGGAQEYAEPGSPAEVRPTHGTVFPTRPGRERFENALNMAPSQSLQGDREADRQWLAAVETSFEEHGLMWTWKTRERHAALTPAVERVRGDSFGDIPTWDGTGDEPSKVAAVYMVSQHSVRDGQMPGSLFMATSRDNNIVRGYFWAPEKTEYLPNLAPLESKLCSFAEGHLCNHAGRLVDYEPGSMTLQDAIDTMPTVRLQAYRRVMGVSHTR